AFPSQSTSSPRRQPKLQIARLLQIGEHSVNQQDVGENQQARRPFRRQRVAAPGPPAPQRRQGRQGDTDVQCDHLSPPNTETKTLPIAKSGSSSATFCFANSAWRLFSKRKCTTDCRSM